MDLICAVCGGRIDGTQRFCPHCGAPQSAPNRAPGGQPYQQPMQPPMQQPPYQQPMQQPPQPWQGQPPMQQPPYQQPMQQPVRQPVRQAAPQQPVPPVQPRQRQVPPRQAPQPQPRKKGKGGLVAILVSVLVIGLGVTAFFGFREGGFLRGEKEPQSSQGGSQGSTPGGSQGGTPGGSQGGAQAGNQSGTNTEALLNYAKRLEEMGNPEAAAAIYEKLRLAGQADLEQAAEACRDDPERLMLDALRGEDLYRTLSGETEEAELPFSDVDAGKYYYAAALWAKEAHIVFGDAFLPGEPVTRGEALLFLWRAKGRPVPGTAYCPYEDVEKFGVGYDAVLWALGEDLITPQADGLLHLEEPAQRAQAVTFLYGAEGRPDTAWSQVFDDVKESSYYALPAIWATGKGAVSQGSFRPKDACTRAEYLTMLLRLYG